MKLVRFSHMESHGDGEESGNGQRNCKDGNVNRVDMTEKKQMAGKLDGFRKFL